MDIFVYGCVLIIFDWYVIYKMILYFVDFLDFCRYLFEEYVNIFGNIKVWKEVFIWRIIFLCIGY